VFVEAHPAEMTVMRSIAVIKENSLADCMIASSHFS
jgi:hypothetical protein